MTDLEKFIDENEELIDQNTKESWLTVFSKFEDEYPEDLAGQLGSLLLDSDADPCAIIGEVPRRFLQYQKQITSYEIPKNCTYIGMSAFEDTSITEIEIPNRVTALDYLAFGGSKLKSIKLPNSVKALENAVFHSCKELEEVDLGNLVYLGEDCFVDCIHLNKVIIPNTIFRLELTCFYGCNRLKEIIYKGTIEEFENLVSDDLDNWKLSYKIICSDGIFEN